MGRHEEAPRRPRVKPALRVLARDSRTLQFGRHPARAVLLTEVEPQVRRLIEHLDGTRTLAQAIALSEIDEHTAGETVRLLAARGLLEDATVRPPAFSPAERERLAPDRLVLSLAATDGGWGALERRRRAGVRVYGLGRVGAQVATLLAAAGVGRLCVLDPAPTRREDLAPGGLTGAELGAAREDGVLARARVVAPEVHAWPGRQAAGLGDGAPGPDLVILTGAPDPLLVRELTARRIPHLVAGCEEGCGEVGPLVLPGVTACLDCRDLGRRDADPGWVFTTPSASGESSCDTVLAALVAALTAGHALAFLDGTGPGVSNSTVEISADFRWRQRAWSRHPQCRCSRKDQAALTMVR
ncbi:ThiF family adenylyltransferase [Acrocarpospora catenulata]|uniref:ThiF family adenylyltransferase n=1 Tax=Acrocarpospora catenulata TaxID=2836182 RepID=UPI001BD918BB|nr:ThiF family adenylyltransferase [Acrocarpospora catenulata]